MCRVEDQVCLGKRRVNGERRNFRNASDHVKNELRLTENTHGKRKSLKEAKKQLEDYVALGFNVISSEELATDRKDDPIPRREELIEIA
ncbi:hypothetical protein FS749_002057 [Ceratobasidium sp. UAMH 11750]|nr:hypothetical protein FS749_002057 [Ceratobasidium sp. UAMH 11750]